MGSYKEALKRGQKEYRECINRGEYPYLPALSEFIQEDRIASGTDLGLCVIPTDFIVGTRSPGRVRAFARNFMPLMPETSEFATKWNALSRAHESEGIRDPIKAFEYMNRYYVAEGNKRASILKFYGAPTVAAEVVRVWPIRDGDRGVERYYEYVDFHRLSGINFLEFSRDGQYAQFQRLLGKGPEEPWTEEERRHITARLHLFGEAYEELGGRQLRSTLGDAVLAFLRVSGWDGLENCSRDELRAKLGKIWEEIKLQQEESPADVKLEPTEEKDKKPGLISLVLGSSPAPIKAAFLHDRTIEESAWTLSHELGRQRVQEVLGGEVQTTPYFKTMDDPMGTVERAVKDGNSVIFTTSPVLLPLALRAAVEMPEIQVFNCSVGQPHRYIRTYYPRMYEAKFVLGAIAGSLAGANHLGYVCDYPIYGQVAGINAFALGAQMVNPRLKVFLEWSSVGGAAAAVNRLRERGISLISSRDLVRPGDWDSISFGLSLVNDDGQVQLAMPHWRWDVYYEAMLRQLRGKILIREDAETPRAVNYYWGMKVGVVDVRCNEVVPDATRRLTRVLKESVSGGICNPFQGPLYANNGRKIEGWESALSVEEIIAMDWLNENVEGSIPEYEELSEVGKATVDVLGVPKVIETRKTGPEK